MDMIFDAMSAWNSFGLFLMAFVFILIGGGIFSYELLWFVNARRVRARIKAISVTAKTKSVKSRSEHVAVDVEKTAEDGKSSGGFSLVFALLFLSIPLIFTGFGLYMGYKYFSLTSGGEYAQARVVDNEREYDSDGDVSYNTVLEFRDFNGITRRVKDTISYGGKPSYDIGTRIGVYYDFENPERFVIDDFWHNMTIALIFIAIVPVFYGFFVFISYLQKRQNSSVEGKKALYTGEVYYPVYEYRLPNGETAEYTGTMGSNMIGMNLPGRRVNMLLSSKGKLKKPSIVGYVIGVIFLCPGLLILSQALETFEFTYMTVLLPVAIIGYIIYKISRLISRIPKKDWDEGMAQLRSEGVTITATTNTHRGKGRALDTNEVRTRIKAFRKNYVVGGYVCFVVFLGLAAGSYYMGIDMADKIRTGVQATGEVVDFRSRYSSSSEGSGYTYYSIVKFKDDAGRFIKFEDSVGSSHRMHKRGDVVDVLYHPDAPEDAIIDRGIFNWFFSGALGLGAFLLLYIALYNMRVARLYGRSSFADRV